MNDNRVGAVVVIFNPHAAIADHVRKLSDQFASISVIVNAASATVVDALQRIGNGEIIVNDRNVGIAAALNQGIRSQFQDDAIDYVVLLDQDSAPSPDMAITLKVAFQEALILGLNPACVGPRLVDIKNPAIFGYGTPSATGLTIVPTIATSGTLLSRSSFQKVGGMMERLFIDQVDHEWCFRARSKDLQTLVAHDAILAHDLGVGVIHFFGKAKSIHRSPIRHYFIVRNTLHLVTLRYVPFRWKTIELLKTVRRCAAYLLYSENRWLTFRAIHQGTKAAISGNIAGKIPDFLGGTENNIGSETKPS